MASAHFSKDRDRGSSKKGDSFAGKLNGLVGKSSQASQSAPYSAKKYVIENGNAYYMSPDPLDRSFASLPPKVRKAMPVFLIAALIVAIVLLYFYFDKVYATPMREQESIQATLEKDSPLNLPDLQKLVVMDNADILASLEADGDAIYEKPSQDGESATYVKIPSDMELAQATSLYLSGLDNLSAADLTSLLYGSWTLNVDREAGTNMGLHYVDFSAANADAAIQSALEAANLADLDKADSGIDSSGNTYVMGNLTISGSAYTWRVSCTDLENIYSQEGLPDNAYYVGIRLSA